MLKLITPRLNILGLPNAVCRKISIHGEDFQIVFKEKWSLKCKLKNTIGCNLLVKGKEDV